MINLHTFNTPNGHKASILLEELGLKYTVHKIDLTQGEHRGPAHMAISPIGKIPAVVEELPGGRIRRLFGSGAIMAHYAERAGRLVPQGVDQRTEALSWFMLGISDLGPAGVNLFRFNVRAPEKIPYAIDLFKDELVRCYDALNQRLADVEWLAEEYSIADIACFPFFAVAVASKNELADRYPNLKRWHDAMMARPAVVRGLAVPG